MLKNLVQIESGPSSSKLPSAPEPVASRPRSGDKGAIELEDKPRHAIRKDIRLETARGQQTSSSYPPKKAHASEAAARPSTLKSERDGGPGADLEMNTPPGSPSAGRGAGGAPPADAFEVLPSLNSPPMNRYRYAGICMMNFMGGLTDSSPGALIPYMEVYYGIGYGTVSLLFVGNALGFILAALVVDTLRHRIGTAGTLALGQSCAALGYIPLALAAPPFAIICVAFFFVGFGLALCLAINSVFCANLARGTTMLGGMHGSYGIGGTVGPLIATSIAVSGGRDPGSDAWGKYYYMGLAIATLNAAWNVWAWRDYEKDSMPTVAASSTDEAGIQQQQPSTTTFKDHLTSLGLAFKSRVILLGAIFIFAYQGAEVSISGWVISFLITARGGDPERVGYVTSGFWGGIALGRFVLSPLGARVGEKPFVWALVAGAGVFQLLVWWVPNIVGEAVALAIVGLLLGPVYPCAAQVFARNMSRREQVVGMGIINSLGSSGGAVAPFTTGLLAQAAGTWVLHPIALGLFVVMGVMWYGQPRPEKRSE